MDYLRILEGSYLLSLEEDHEPPISRFDWLGEYIFDFTIYDGKMSNLFAENAVDVCRAITDGTTFDFIRSSDDNYMWYLLMCNMPFFKERLEWGGSIRGAWWAYRQPLLFTSGVYHNGDWLTELAFTREDWISFIKVIIAFAEGTDGA